MVEKEARKTLKQIQDVQEEPTLATGRQVTMILGERL